MAPRLLDWWKRRPSAAFVVVETIVIAVASSVLVVTLSVFGLHPLAFTAHVSAWHQLPPNIRTTDDLKPIIERLLARSPTLRQQSARIAMAKQTWVSVTLSATRFPSLTRARSTARRYQTGLLVVDVEIPPASQEFGELLGHELEHVTEFIERVDFKKLATSRNGGIVQCGSDGSFETERAQQAGRAVQLELEATSATYPTEVARQQERPAPAVSRPLRR